MKLDPKKRLESKPQEIASLNIKNIMLSKKDKKVKHNRVPDDETLGKMSNP